MLTCIAMHTKATAIAIAASKLGFPKVHFALTLEVIQQDFRGKSHLLYVFAESG